MIHHRTIFQRSVEVRKRQYTAARVNVGLLSGEWVWPDFENVEFQW